MGFNLFFCQGIGKSPFSSVKSPDLFSFRLSRIRVIRTLCQVHFKKKKKGFTPTKNNKDLCSKSLLFFILLKDICLFFCNYNIHLARAYKVPIGICHYCNNPYIGLSHPSKKNNLSIYQCLFHPSYAHKSFPAEHYPSNYLFLT